MPEAILAAGLGADPIPLPCNPGPRETWICQAPVKKALPPKAGGMEVRGVEHLQKRAAAGKSSQENLSLSPGKRLLLPAHLQ